MSGSTIDRTANDADPDAAAIALVTARLAEGASEPSLAAVADEVAWARILTESGNHRGDPLRGSARRDAARSHLAVAAAAFLLVVIAVAWGAARGGGDSPVATIPPSPSVELPAPLTGAPTGMTLLLSDLGAFRALTAIDLDSGVAHEIPIEVGTDINHFEIAADGSVLVWPQGWENEGQTNYRLGEQLSTEGLANRLVPSRSPMEIQPPTASQASSYFGSCTPFAPLRTHLAPGQPDADGACTDVQLVAPARTPRTFFLGADWSIDADSDRPLSSVSLDESKIVAFDRAGRTRIVATADGAVSPASNAPASLGDRLLNGTDPQYDDPSLIPWGTEQAVATATWSSDARYFVIYAPGTTAEMSEHPPSGSLVEAAPPLLFVLDTTNGRWSEVELPVGVTSQDVALIPTASVPAVDTTDIDLCPTVSSTLLTGARAIDASEPCRLPAL